MQNSAALQHFEPMSLWGGYIALPIAELELGIYVASFWAEVLAGAAWVDGNGFGWEKLAFCFAVLLLERLRLWGFFVVERLR